MNPEDGSRLEEFRQFRKEVRGSSEYLLVASISPKTSTMPFLAPPEERRFCGDWFLRIISKGFGSF